MILDIQFVESNQSFDCKFGEINNVSDGGYERGYEKGYEDGFDDGFDDAYKEEQEKSINITENSTTEVTPDEDMVLSKVTVKVDVPDKSEELAVLIDQSGVLDSTDGTVTEKVEQLIDKAEVEQHIYNASLLKENCQHEFRHWTGKKLPKTNYVKSIYFNYFVADSSIETIDYYLDWQKGGNLNSAFENTPNFKTMIGVNTAEATSVGSLFNKSGIVSIQEPFNFSKIANSGGMSAFTTAKSLVEVRFVPETIKLSIMFASGVLSDESIQSIFDGLADLSENAPQQLTLNSAILERLTDSQLVMLINKNWYLE